MVSDGLNHDVLDNALDIVMILDDNGNASYINKAGIEELGYDLEEITVFKVFRTLFTKNVDYREYINSIDGEKIKGFVYRKNNTCFPAYIRVKQIPDRNGKPMKVVSVLNVTDEQELERVRKKMELTMQERNEFSANITHELRTPVNGIKGHIKNLMNKEEDDEKRKTMDIVMKCCLNMEKIINNLLDFSKLEAGKFELVEEEFAIRECIEHVISTSDSIANEKGIRLTSFVADDVPQMIISDELRLVQILNNLISNAIKFTSVGYVKVEVYQTYHKLDTTELTFMVSDTGIGISTTEQDKLFKSFSQVDGTVTRQYGGTGLGLFVTKQLVELMHGEITVSSHKGEGSTFTFTIHVHTNKREEELVLEEVAHVEDMALEIQEPVIHKPIYTYDSEDNQIQRHSTVERLLICIELHKWDKAEQFADSLKQLLAGAEPELKSKILRMQMAVRKEDYDNSIQYLNQIKQMIGL